jgi:hypothetical protein
MAFLLRTAEGEDIGADESLTDPESVARHSMARSWQRRSQNVTSRCVAATREQASAVTMENITPPPKRISAIGAAKAEAGR